MAEITEKLKEFLKGNQSIILSTIGAQGSPDLRMIGGFGIVDFITYIATSKESNKVKQLEQENRVALFFHQENDVISKIYNVTIFGKAILVNSEAEFNKGRDLILSRKPHLNISHETHNIYKINPEIIKSLDMGEKNPKDRVTIFELELD